MGKAVLEASVFVRSLFGIPSNKEGLIDIAVTVNVYRLDRPHARLAPPFLYCHL
jgi:hypothetical protein